MFIKRGSTLNKSSSPTQASLWADPSLVTASGVNVTINCTPSDPSSRHFPRSHSSHYHSSTPSTSKCWSLVSLLRILLILHGALHVLCSEDEERLVRDLFRDYNKLIRPVEAMNETVEVKFKLNFIQLINVNEKNQIMTSNVWLQLSWYDYQLRWDEADYGGIAVLRLPPDKVWKPDVVLFNNADGNYEVRYKSNVLIYPQGNVVWIPPAIYQSSCTIDVTYFPFDQQRCVLKFGSWTFNGDQVSLRLLNDNAWVDLSDYWKSGTWDIVEVPAFLNVYNGSKSGKPTETDISFFITIRRKTLFYTVNLILPTLLISFLCILVFYLPAEAGEKVTLGISILLSLVVFLLLVSKILPPTSLVLPLIAKYLLFTFLMNCISILATVIIINWNFRGPRTHKMPNWIRAVFLKYLPILLLIRRPKKTRLRWMMDMPSLGVHYHPYHSSDRNPGAQGLNSTPSGPNMNQHQHSQQPQHHHQQQPPQHLQHHPGSSRLPPAPTPYNPGVCPDPMKMNDPYASCHRSKGNSTQSSTLNRLDHLSQSLDHYNPSPPCDPHMGGSLMGSGSNTLTHPHHNHNSHQQLPTQPSLPQHPHHPQCTINHRKNSIDGVSPKEEDTIETLYLTPEAYRATEAIEFIAEHLRSEDEYIQIREDWKYVAMVIDRLQLYLFFAVTTFGTLAILLDAPHIFEYVDQDKVIEIHKAKSS